MRKGIYTGSFDPVTFGHIDMIERGSKMFDTLYVAVAHNLNKNYLFTLEERMELLKEVCKPYKNVSIVFCDTLLVDFASKIGANTILRGLRVLTDFEYELQMATTNKELNNDIETIFMMTNVKYSFLSSSAVKEIASFKGDVSGFVPEIVKKALVSKYSK